MMIGGDGWCRVGEDSWILGGEAGVRGVMR
jgi:hypothetical protein